MSLVGIWKGLLCDDVCPGYSVGQVQCPSGFIPSYLTLTQFGFLAKVILMSVIISLIRKEWISVLKLYAARKVFGRNQVFDSIMIGILWEVGRKNICG